MFLWLLTFYQIGPNGLFIFYQVFNLILQSAEVLIWYKIAKLIQKKSYIRYIPNRINDLGYYYT